MDQAGAVISVVSGTALVAASFIAKKFYAAQGLSATPRFGREIAAWKGRLLFRVVGSAMILFGLLYFLTDH